MLDIQTNYYFLLSKKKTDFLGLHVTCAVYNHDGSEILASYNDDDIYIFDTSSQPGTYKHTYQGHRNGATIKGVSYFGPKSEYVVSGSDCGYVYFWERESEAIVQWMLADDNGVVSKDFYKQRTKFSTVFFLILSKVGCDIRTIYRIEASWL